MIVFIEYTAIVLVVNIKIFKWKILIIYLIFAQNINFGFTLEAGPTSTYTLCFREKNKIKYTLLS